MDLRAFASLIKRRWLTIVALVVIGMLSAAAFSALQTPSYTSTAKLLVSTPAASNASDLQSGSVFTQQVVTTYAEVATTPYVLNSVIANLNLSTNAADLAQSVSASAPASTSVIDITVKSSSAALGAQIANGIASELAARAPEVTPSSVAGTSAITISTIQPAVPATAPASPSWLINMALGFLVGLFLGIAAAVIRETTDTRLKTSAEVSTLTGLPVLGGIAFDARERRSPLVSVADVKRARVESYRSLRTTLQFLNPDEFTVAYVVTSPARSEQQSLTAANLAIVFAEAGKRVVVVDANVARPRVAQLLGVTADRGLLEVLRGGVSLDDVLQVAETDNVVVMTAGHPVSHTTELLESEAMVELIAQLKTRFDVVIIDAPPVLTSTDAVVLAKQVDGSIIVTGQGRDRRDDLEAAASAFRQVEAPMLGVVVRLMRGADHGSVVRGELTAPPAPTKLSRIRAD